LIEDLPDPATLTLAREAPIPVAVVTGFLGSGKTTLIRRLLRESDFVETAVIVNEFGEVGLDHLMLDSAREDVLVLEGGCLCCAAQGDLVRALRSLLARSTRGELPNFRRVVIETSGLADPGPILLSLMTDPLRLSRFKLRALTATVDCLLGGEALRRQDVAARQLALADRVLLTKTDLADEVQQAAARETARGLTSAPIEAAAGRLGAILFDTAVRDVELPFPDERHRHGSYATASRSIEEPLTWSRVESWLRHTVEDLGEDLLRLKALIPIEGEAGPVAFHAVQHVIHRPECLPARPGSEGKGRIVIIGRSKDEWRLREALVSIDGASP